MIIGITGNYGSGKSTIAGMLKEEGFTVIDVDKIGHRVLDGECYQQVVEAFGANILGDDLCIKRNVLRDIVFSDLNKLRLLESILHPIMIIEIEKEIRRLAKPIIIDAALLFDMNINLYCDAVVVVKCKKQYGRLNKKETTRILYAQLSEDELVDKADFVIDNNGSIEDTIAQVKELIKKLM